MKMTKRLAAIAATVVMTMTSMIGTGASAALINETETRSDDFSVYSTIFFGDYSELNAFPTVARITTLGFEYDDSYKFISYMTFEYNSSGNLVVQNTSYNSGTEKPLSCTQTLDSATARRDYTATVRKTSSANSPSIDSYSVIINK